MTKLIPVKYGERNYPPRIEANICEVAGNFDTKEIDVNTPYSLHTEYSWGERTFSSEIVKNLKGITSAHKNNIPQLWYNDKWAEDFFLFIKRLIDKNQPPNVLEIHPPFNDYCISFDIFLDTFKIFYEKYKKNYPKTKTEFLIENRCGTLNTGGKFILSKYSDVLEFCKTLRSPKYSDIDLKIVLDYPQLFSEVYISTNNKKKKELRQKGKIIDDEILEKIISFNKDLKEYKKLIGGFHMWGKRKNKNGKWTAHQGNFNDLFSYDDKLKNDFLDSVSSTFNDNNDRYFVPEVNSGDEDLLSIIDNMEQYKRFVFPYKKSYNIVE